MNLLCLVLCVFAVFIMFTSVSSSKAQETTYYFKDICGNSSLPHVIHLKPKDSHSTGILTLDNFVSDGNDINCTVILKPVHNRFFVFLTFFDVFMRHSTDSLSVAIENKTELSNFICPTENCEMFHSSKGSPISINFISMFNGSNSAETSHFKAIFTMYYKGKCNSKHYKCKSGSCIWKDLVCDGHNHCGDSSSLPNCDVKNNGTLWAAVTIALGALSFIILVPLFCFLAISGGKINRSNIVIPPNPTLVFPSINDESTALLSGRGSLTDLSADPSFSGGRKYSSLQSSNDFCADRVEDNSYSSLDKGDKSTKKPDSCSSLDAV